MDESLDSEAEARSEGRRPELRADRGPARGRPLLIRGAGGVQRRWQLRSGPSCRCSSSMSSHASSPLSERPLPILSGQDAMTSAGISCSPTCPTAPRRIVFIPTFGRSGTKSPEVPEGSRETSSEAQPHAVRLRRRS